MPSVLSPTRTDPSRRTQFTEPSASAAGVSRSTSEATTSLCGIVTEHPSMPRATMAARAPAASPDATGAARKRQSRPSAAYPALWICGDFECRTGSPITIARRVAPVIGCW